MSCKPSRYTVRIDERSSTYELPQDPFSSIGTSMTQVDDAVGRADSSGPMLERELGRPALIGRGSEIAAVREVLAQVADHGSVLAISGEPGVGKTAVVDAVVDHARWRGLDVLRASGVEAEQDVPWAILHQLLHVLHDRIAGLPHPQRDALRGVFGEKDETAPAAFTVGLGALTLLSERASNAGLLVVVEDVHWVDAATKSALSFLARRIASEPIVLILTSRATEQSVDYFRAINALLLELAPLNEHHSRELLVDRRIALSNAMIERIVREAMGNPLALIELSAASYRIDDPAMTELPVSKKLEKAFGQRLEGLAVEERAVMLIAAVSADSRQKDILDAAARLLGAHVDIQTVDSLILLELLRRSRGEITFRHPLVRSAVIRSVSPTERAQAHRAVASLLPPGTDRKLWHLAVIAETVDESLADALEQSASRVLKGGDPHTALSAFRRAAELSPSIEDRARRNYRAAAVAVSIHLIREAKELVDMVGHQTTDPVLVARIAWLRQLIPGSALESGSIDITLAIADELHQAGETSQAISVFTAVGMQHWGASPEGGIWNRMIDRAEEFGAAPTDPRLLWLKAFGTPGLNSRTVRATIDSIDPDQVNDLEHLKLLATAYPLTGALERTDQFIDRALDELRRSGNVVMLSTTMLTAASIHAIAGRFRDMQSVADEAQQLAEEAQQPFLALAAYLHLQIARAYLGEDVDVDRLHERFPDASPAFLQNPYPVMKLIAHGIADAGRGLHNEAYEQLRRTLDPNSPLAHWGWGLNVAFLHFVDSAVRSGRHGQAQAHVRRLAELTGLSDSPLHLSQLVVARALLSIESEDESDNAFRLAISPIHNKLPYWRARSMLSYGERLRRLRRITEARAQLREARTEFERMKVSQWASIARAELEAAGESSPKRGITVGSDLTPQERRVVDLAKQGLTNREIAERLFLSPRTIATHLHSVFRKLDISSRSELGVIDR